VNRVDGKRLEFLRVATRSRERNPLRHENIASVRLVNLLTETGGPLETGLCGLGIAFEQGQRSAAGLDQIPITRFMARLEEFEPSVEHSPKFSKSGFEEPVGFE
jgi:hypothetical protein